MLPPEIIEKIRKEREERDRPALQIPQYQPEIHFPEDKEEKKEEPKKVIVIELA